MRSAQVSELKERLDEVIEAVKNGEMVEIWEGEASVGELVPSTADFALPDLRPGESLETHLDEKTRHDWETFFLDNLWQIERATDFVRRKYGLQGRDAEDFASFVLIKLIENDYAVLRKFEHKCSLSTYLTIVIKRHYADQKIHEWGKWRPSMKAREAGEAGILLERLVRRDGLGIAEASTIVSQKYTELDSRELEVLASSIVKLPAQRSAEVERTEESRKAASDVSAEDEVLTSELETAARRTSEILQRELDRLPAEDRQLMKLRYIDAMKVSTMARLLHVDQKQLSRRIERLGAAMREALLAAGVAMSDIGDQLTHGFSDQFAIEARLDDLVRQGKARRGTGTLPPDFLTRPLPKAKKSVLEALLEDRHSD